MKSNILLVFPLLILLLGTGLSGCEEYDDGSFTPQVIAEPEVPIDTSYTVEDPCLTSSCALRTLRLSGGTDAPYEQPFYSNYDLLREDAVWGTMTSAVIVLHGANRNGNEYFNWITNAVLALGKSNETVIVAPQFNLQGDVGANDRLLYWSSQGWRRGFQSQNVAAVKYSSFDVVDSMMAFLADPARFPNLKNIVITGHSAGAQFTNLYATASPMEDSLSGIDVQYLVANSQYFFYPGPERWDPDAGQFAVPAGCDGYQAWPYGSESLPDYADRFAPAVLGERFTSRRLTFLLGTLDLLTSGTLNTRDCEATLLGENRFDRGEKIFDYVQAFFPNQNHQKVLVENVGHDAAQMYNSASGLETLEAMLD
jgi:hypothetical protein